MTTRLATTVALVILAAAVATCGGDRPPTAPTPTPPPFQVEPPVPPPPPQTYTLSGIVTDYAGRPLPGVAVTLSGTSEGRETSTDAGGRYSFDKTGGAIQVTAALERFHNDHRSLWMGRDLVIDLELTPPLSIDAGQEVSAELHRGPQSSACAAFLSTIVDSCRPVTVRVTRSGRLRANVTWNGAPGVALTQLVNIAAGIALPKYGPTACCESGLVLQAPVTEGSHVALLVRHHDPRIGPVQFTLRTSIE